MNHENVASPAEVPTPEQVSDYLYSRGWHREPESWRGSQVWTWPESSDEQVLLPPRLEYRDDRELVLRTLYALSQIEGRDPHDLIRAISQPLVDTQYFHTQPPSAPGTVPLLSGIGALEGIRGAFTLAAQTVLDRLRLGRERSAKEMDEFLQRVRLGPSTSGSYIFSAEVPLTPPRTDQLFPEPPRERRIVQTMHRAIATAAYATRAAEENDGQVDTFEEAMHAGVSAQLCDSLAQFGGQDYGREFSIRFSWSPVLPKDTHEPSDQLYFGPRAVDILQSAGEHLRTLEPPRNPRKAEGIRDILQYTGQARIAGKIIGTERHSPPEGGFVKIRGTLTTGQRSRNSTLLVRLPAQDYNAALAAHSRDDTLEAEGQLDSTGNRREIIPDRVLVNGRPLREIR